LNNSLKPFKFLKLNYFNIFYRDIIRRCEESQVAYDQPQLIIKLILSLGNNVAHSTPDSYMLMHRIKKKEHFDQHFHGHIYVGV